MDYLNTVMMPSLAPAAAPSMPSAPGRPSNRGMRPASPYGAPMGGPMPYAAPRLPSFGPMQGYAPPVAQQTQDDLGAHLFGGANRRGFFGGGYYEANPANFLMPQIQRMNQRYDTAANMGLSSQQSARAGQDALTRSLFGTLAGQTPSVAQQQLNRATDQSVSNAFALGASGPRSGLATKMAADRAAQAQQEAAGQAALLRAQEIASTQGLLGDTLGQQRQQDLGLFQVGAGGQADINAQQLQANMNREQLGLNAFTNQPSGVFQSLAGIGGAAAGAITPFLYSGGEVPGRAPVGGRRDTAKNDVVPAVISPGEVVLPRSVTKAKDSPERAKQFVAALRKQKKAA